MVYGGVRKELAHVIAEVMADTIPAFGAERWGFYDTDGRRSGPETRSASPVRIVRGEDFHSVNLRGLYPCGEVAGYAGGITSAAVDGIRCAEAVIGRYQE